MAGKRPESMVTWGQWLPCPAVAKVPRPSMADGHGLRPRPELPVEGGYEAYPTTFCTANGETHVEEFGSIATSYVLCKTPAVLAIGRRCAELGYSFAWKPAQDPYMITPEGMIVVLEQKGYIPYFKVGSSHCAPFGPDDEGWFSLHNGGRHYVAAPAEGVMLTVTLTLRENSRSKGAGA